jgi:ferrochelatase
MTGPAVLLMAYGTPNFIEEIEPYLTDIWRGRKPSPEAVEDLKRRYLKIGGGSPLLEITREQASALEKRLRSEGVKSQVYFGMKHWHPYISEVVPKILDDGYDRIVGLVLAPHYSMMSIGGYKNALKEAVSSNGGLSVDFVDSWYDNPIFHQAVQEKIQGALKQFVQPENVHLLFTAHSLPERILASKDPYPAQLEYSCRSVANLLGRKEWSFAYQSAGQTDEKWLGPNILDYLRKSQHRISDVLAVPIGFVADHLEILYDIDVEAQDLAQAVGVNLRRTESLNTSPTFISALTDIVQKRMSSAGVALRFS